jgi:hypothetical protein
MSIRNLVLSAGLSLAFVGCAVSATSEADQQSVGFDAAGQATATECTKSAEACEQKAAQCTEAQKAACNKKKVCPETGASTEG